MNSRLELAGCTIGNDMSSRDIEGENPLYLPQAKVYNQCCGLGPWITLAYAMPPRSEIGIQLQIHRGGRVVYQGNTGIDQMARSFEELIGWLGRENSFPHGVFLLTGTGVVPSSDFTLEAGDQVDITIDGIGTLSNSIVQGECDAIENDENAAGTDWRGNGGRGGRMWEALRSTIRLGGSRFPKPFPSVPGRIVMRRCKRRRAPRPACATCPVSKSASSSTDTRHASSTRKEELVERAHLETAYPKSPRLADVELPRTTSQLRQAAAAAREGSWALPTLDTKLNIRSCHAPLGPVCVFGPNNFPFAFNSIAGGDFATAIAAGNPVLAKANSSHPGTTQLFAEEAHQAAIETGMPEGTVQLIYRLRHADGERLVADPRVGATAYTGSRSAGLSLKAAADRAGKLDLPGTLQYQPRRHPARCNSAAARQDR